MSDIKQELDFTGDEFWGIGGRYVVNQVTGKRERAPAVDEANGATPAQNGAESAQVGQRPDDAAPGTQIDGQGLAPAK